MDGHITSLCTAAVCPGNARVSSSAILSKYKPSHILKSTLVDALSIEIRAVSWGSLDCDDGTPEISLIFGVLAISVNAMAALRSALVR